MSTSGEAPRDTPPHLPLDGEVVLQIRLDFAVTLQLTQHELRIQNDFVIEEAGATVPVAVESPAPDALRSVMNLHQRAVRRAATSGTSALEIDFENGIRVIVPPDERYEAWTLNGPNGFLVVSVPGGELVVWSATPEAPATE